LKHGRTQRPGDSIKEVDGMLTLAGEALARGADWGPGPWWPIFPIFWLFFFGIVIFFLFRSRGRWGHRPSGPSGEGVLAERYARGEINEQEYRERLSVLKSIGSDGGRT
jgi:putative membrane protein